MKKMLFNKSLWKFMFKLSIAFVLLNIFFISCVCTFNHNCREDIIEKKIEVKKVKHLRPIFFIG